VRCPCTWTLHRHFRPDKANLFVKLRDSISRRAKYPGHSSIIAHKCVDQRVANALTPVTFGDDEHRNVAVRHPVAKGTQKPNDLAVLDRDESSLRPRYQFAKLLWIRDVMGPAARLEKAPGCFNLRWQNVADFHLILNATS
jgi:hypothetical protein